MPEYTEADYARDGSPEDWPYVPEEGDEAQFGTYTVDVIEVDTDHRRAIVEPRTASVAWEGWVALWMLAPEEYDRDGYPWEDDEDEDVQDDSDDEQQEYGPHPPDDDE